MAEYQEGDVVLCTVERIEPTSVFVRLPNNREGTLIISEIAPGRIKNLREYVVPNKKIVCKVLRAFGDRVDVSLRRVTSKEKTELMEKYKQEQTAKSAFNQVLKEKAKDVESRILKDFPSLFEFVSAARENPPIIVKYIPKENQEQIQKIIQKKQKDIEVKKELKVKCLAEDGIVRIKKIFAAPQNIKVTYLGAGHFSILIKAKNYKEANHIMTQYIEDIQKQCKQNNCEFEQ
jgi:translation initiation factor 2 alpha subunit (eIF-2alpha)